MTAGWLRPLRRISANRHVDTVMAVLAMAAIVFEFWVRPDHKVGTAAFGILALVIGGAVGLPLAWRRRNALASFAAVLAALLGGSALGHVLFTHQQPGNGVVTPFLVLLVAAFSFGAYGHRRHNLAGAAVVVGAFLVKEIADVVGGHGVDVGFWVATAIFWAMGRLFRERLRRVAELEDHTERLHEQQDALARAAVVDERSRIARELHDVVAHSVSLIVVQAGAARHTLNRADTETAETLESIETTGRQALVELRRMLGILRRADDEPSLAPMPGLGQIEALAGQVRDAGLPVELRIEGQPVPLPPGVDLAAYRILQEALTNTLKHAGPARARVVVSYRPHELELEVIDDGRPETANGGGTWRGRTGHGLLGMRERVSLYGGVLQASPQPAGGFVVSARLPLESNRS